MIAGGIGVVCIAVFASIAVVDGMRDGRQKSEQRQKKEEALAKQLEENRKAFMDERDSMFSKARSAMLVEDYAAVVEIANEFRHYDQGDYRGLNDMYVKARKEQLHVELDDVGENDSRRRYQIYTELAELDPSNTTYQDKSQSLKRVVEKLDVEKRQAEMARAAAGRAASLRKAELEKQFNLRDGSHRGVVKYVKSTMHDPSSFKHVKTGYIDEGEYLVIEMSFRGKNAFGGLVLNKVLAEVSLDGDVLSLVNVE
jgi:hypothetical protein